MLMISTSSPFLWDQKGMWFFQDYLAWYKDRPSSSKDVKTGTLYIIDYILHLFQWTYIIL